MSWVSHSSLASAVSAEGGLGVLGAATMEPEELALEIDTLRALTDRPFGVNVPLLCLTPDGADRTPALIDVVCIQRVPVVITGAGSPRRYTAQLHAAGCCVLHVVPSPELAQKAQAAGVDAVIAESTEAGGHIRADGLATMALVPQVADAVSIPVAAAGGIADGRGAVAALALGAEAVQLGTRFVATVECEAHPSFKAAVAAASAEASVIYSRAHHASRALATDIVRQLVQLERGGAPTDEIARLRGRQRARLGCVEGEVEQGILPAGCGVGLISNVKSVAEVFADLKREMRATLDRLEGARDVGRGVR